MASFGFFSPYKAIAAVTATANVVAKAITNAVTGPARVSVSNARLASNLAGSIFSACMVEGIAALHAKEQAEAKARQEVKYPVPVFNNKARPLMVIGLAALNMLLAYAADSVSEPDGTANMMLKAFSAGLFDTAIEYVLPPSATPRAHY